MQPRGHGRWVESRGRSSISTPPQVTWRQSIRESLSAKKGAHPNSTRVYNPPFHSANPGGAGVSHAINWLVASRHGFEPRSPPVSSVKANRRPEASGGMKRMRSAMTQATRRSPDRPSRTMASVSSPVVNESRRTWRSAATSAARASSAGVTGVSSVGSAGAVVVSAENSSGASAGASPVVWSPEATVEGAVVPVVVVTSIGSSTSGVPRSPPDGPADRMATSAATPTSATRPIRSAQRRPGFTPRPRRGVRSSARASACSRSPAEDHEVSGREGSPG